MIGSSVAFRSKDNLPPVLPGFMHINRYWDPHDETFTAKILPGQYYVTLHDEKIVTVLGSCVSACIRDSVFGISGMNHFMLPGGNDFNPNKGRDRITDESARYGVYAMELLINDILKNGGRRENLEVKITGGGRMLANMSDVGKRNIDFVRKFLVTEGLAIVAEDVGDIYPRKVQYQSSSGKVRVKKLRNMHNDTIARREKDYLRDLQVSDVQGDVELF
jgi:chemotaxis protein CheD